MANPIVYREQVLDALRSIPGITVFDGYVPTNIPQDPGGFIQPYVLFTAGEGGEVGGVDPERDLSNQVDLDGLIWDFQTTSVGASPGVCVAVARAVSLRMTNYPMGTSHVVPNPDGFVVPTPVRDSSETPARFMLPRPWRLATT